MSGDASALQQLKADLAGVLLEDERVKTRRGLATGVEAFDGALLWKGFPQGELSLLSGVRGVGLTSLCLRAMEKVQARGGWCAWVNSEWSLFPTESLSRLVPSRLVIVQKPADVRKLFWILQEMISSSLFDFVVCHLPEFSLRPSDLSRLKSLARGFEVALVFLIEGPPRLQAFFALVLEAPSGHRLILRRALHRQTPRLLEGVLSHARAVPAVSGRSPPLLG